MQEGLVKKPQNLPETLILTGVAGCGCISLASGGKLSEDPTTELVCRLAPATSIFSLGFLLLLFALRIPGASECSESVTSSEKPVQDMLETEHLWEMQPKTKLFTCDYQLFSAATLLVVFVCDKPSDKVKVLYL